nr:tetratricopeptide repeat protein [uncultured Fluviicola sp.]
MKTAILTILCILAFNSFGQEWKEPLNEARRLYKKGNYKEALKYYKRAERLAPNDVDLSQEIGQTAYRANDFETAAENFERQANNAPTKEKEIRARTSLGESRMKQQDFQGAIDAYKDVLRLDQDNEKARQRLVEAKRLLEQQKRQEQNKQDKENEEQNKDNQSQPNNNQKDQKDSKDKQNQQDQKSQQQKSEQKKLQDKETERKLDEFSKQEQNTKKRLDGSKGTTGGKRARKDW